MEDLNKAYKTIKVNIREEICFIKISREKENNSINDVMIEEFKDILDYCEKNIKIVVIEGNDKTFCTGADLKAIVQKQEDISCYERNPQQLYEVWIKISRGSFISICHVKGNVNAGGIGFISASDIVIADINAKFSLSEMLFDLIPACVLPFLINKIGINKTNYFTLMTKPFSSMEAYDCGLITIYSDKTEFELNKCLLRLKYLSKEIIGIYKKYINNLNKFIDDSQKIAIDTNIEVFSNEKAIKKIKEFIMYNKYPWI